MSLFQINNLMMNFLHHETLGIILLPTPIIRLDWKRILRKNKSTTHQENNKTITCAMFPYRLFSSGKKSIFKIEVTLFSPAVETYN